LLSTDARELTAQQYLAVGLHCQCINEPGQARVWVERIRQASSAIEPRDAVARLSTDGIEIPTHQNLAVRLKCERIHTIGGEWVKRDVKRAVRIHPGDTLPSHHPPAIR
jgi:hypothetical protein